MTKHMAPSLPMEDLELQIAKRMEDIALLRTMGNSLQTKLNPNGVVEVSGPTQSSLIKRMVIQALRDIPGIQDVEDHIVADPDLELAAAQALAQDDRTRDLPPGRVFIRSHLGVITLFGKLPPGFLLKDLVDVVSGVGGVHDVEVKLQI